MNKNKLEPFIFLFHVVGIPLIIAFVLVIVGETIARLTIRPNSVLLVENNIYRKTSSEFSKLYTYNNDGNRDARNYDPYPQEGIFRVMVVGDSYVMGTGLSDDETWPLLLEEKFKEKDIPVEIIPYTKGYETSDQTLVLSSQLERYHPDLVIFNIVAHDIFRNKPFETVIKDFEPPKGGARMQAVSATSSRLAMALRMLFLNNDWIYSYVYGNSFRGLWFEKPISENMIDHMEITTDWLKRAKSICDSSNVQFGLFSTPQLFQILEYNTDTTEYSIDWIDKSLEKFGHDYSIPVISLLPALSEGNKNHTEPLYYVINGHPTPLGARIIADYLFKTSKNWLPANLFNEVE